MAISTEIVGKTFGPFVRDYTFKDLEICALGCGCAWDGKVDLEYVNEHEAKNPDLKVLPIFGVPLTVNEEMTTTLDYGFDYSGSLHYGIDVYFHAPFKMNDHIETFVTQEAIWDRGEGRGSLSKQVGKSYSSDGTHLCTVETYDCCIYDGGFGGEQPPKDVVEYPDREPDLVYEEVCGLQWPLIYRMMGDWHQQHIDWSYTEQTGLARPINHGVCSAGIAMRHVIKLLFPESPSA
ncbi:MAG: 3-alpha,7-alpha,12-alpha-trihydroxy-5-beta-cholest-24-enoyl-CoA hydratase [Eggerthellaceae bacterium]